MSETLKCAHCGAVRPASELKPGRITFRDITWRHGKAKKFINSKTNNYCADKPCHTHDQMAHEG